MKTQVEIYLAPELENLVTDLDAKTEWEEKIIELELEGQIKLTENSPKNSASPYTFMNTQMTLVFETLCPTKCDVAKYNKSVIPLDVLSHIALCKQEKYFNDIEIWYDDKHPDPIVVGFIGTRWGGVKHIIARWGAEIVPYELLVENAISRYTKAFKLACEEAIISAQTALDSHELKVKLLFGGAKGVFDIQPRFDFNLTSFDLGF